jgi:hypothetical protein
MLPDPLELSELADGISVAGIAGDGAGLAFFTTLLAALFAAFFLGAAFFFAAFFLAGFLFAAFFADFFGADFFLGEAFLLAAFFFDFAII